MVGPGPRAIRPSALRRLIVFGIYDEHAQSPPGFRVAIKEIAG